MDNEKKTVLTYEGLKNLEGELQILKTQRRKDVAEKIKEARGQGDLSENAEYDAAKEEQAEIEARIAQLEKMLRNAQVIDEEDIDKSVVSVGSRVILLDMELNEETEYSIVGSAEADPMKGKISNESPLGKAIIGFSSDTVVKVAAPIGELSYKIVSIS